jgi:hypothetical protein
MTSIFIGLIEANLAAIKFEALWVYLGCFCVVFVGIVIVSIRQYIRSEAAAQESTLGKSEIGASNQRAQAPLEVDTDGRVEEGKSNRA